MLNEEEKKAIEELEGFIEDDEIQNISVFTAKKIKNIIDSQQKEIEELKEMKPLQDLIDTNIIIANYSHNYISKDKIREKIKEYLDYDKKVKTYTYDGRENFTFEWYKARALEELLEEK